MEILFAFFRLSWAHKPARSLGNLPEGRSPFVASFFVNPIGIQALSPGLARLAGLPRVIEKGFPTLKGLDQVDSFLVAARRTGVLKPPIRYRFIEIRLTMGLARNTPYR